MPQSGLFHRFALAQRHVWSVCDGHSARALLRGLLLAADAVVFVLGVMNLIWIALLSALVLVEKILPNPRWFRTIAGCAFIGWGIALLV